MCVNCLITCFHHSFSHILFKVVLFFILSIFHFDTFKIYKFRDSRLERCPMMFALALAKMLIAHLSYLESLGINPQSSSCSIGNLWFLLLLY